MIMDKELLFSDAQAVTAAAASTNVVDLGEARDVGTGQNLYVVGVVKTAFTDAGSDSTLAVKLQTDSVENFASPADAQELFVFPALAAVGTTKIARLQPGAIDERYLRAFYTPAGGNLTTGAVSLFIVHDIDQWKAYQDAITIS